MDTTSLTDLAWTALPYVIGAAWIISGDPVTRPLRNAIVRAGRWIGSRTPRVFGMAEACREEMAAAQEAYRAKRYAEATDIADKVYFTPEEPASPKPTRGQRAIDL